MSRLCAWADFVLITKQYLTGTYGRTAHDSLFQVKTPEEVAAALRLL